MAGWRENRIRAGILRLLRLGACGTGAPIQPYGKSGYPAWGEEGEYQAEEDDQVDAAHWFSRSYIEYLEVIIRLFVLAGAPGTARVDDRIGSAGNARHSLTAPAAVQ